MKEDSAMNCLTNIFFKYQTRENDFAVSAILLQSACSGFNYCVLKIRDQLLQCNAQPTSLWLFVFPEGGVLGILMTLRAFDFIENNNVNDSEQFWCIQRG